MTASRESLGTVPLTQTSEPPRRKARPVRGWRLPGEGPTAVLSAVSVTTLAALWWLATHLHWLPPLFLPTPEAVWAAFLDAWHRTEQGEKVDENILAFESWETLASVMTGERYRLLRHVHAHPEPSVSALARALGRQYRRVHADVSALEEAGLLDRSEGRVRTNIDRITAEIRL